MAVAKTTKKTASRKKTTAKKTATKKTATKKTAGKTERRIEVPNRVIELQTKILKGQKSFFDSTFDSVAKLQERQEDGVTGMLERSKVVPEQIREIAETWTDANRKARKSYKATVDKSFTLMIDWWEGMAPAKA